MKHFRPPIFVKRPHEKLVRDACGLMADRRWRTAADVAVTIRCKPTEASQALIELRRRGILIREWIDGPRGAVAIYAHRAAQKREAQ